MKFFIAILALAALACAQEPIREEIPILRQAQDASQDGHYSFTYETGNGIAALETGAPNAQGPEGPVVTSQGMYGYTAPDGTPVVVQYTADEFGFRAQGAHIPTPPPIPDYIQRSIAYNIAAQQAQQAQKAKQQQVQNQRR